MRDITITLPGAIRTRNFQESLPRNVESGVKSKSTLCAYQAQIKKNFLFVDSPLEICRLVSPCIKPFQCVKGLFNLINLFMSYLT